MKKPIVYKTSHRINFSELDPYNHLRTEVYAGYYIDHRMIGLRDNAGWDLKTLGHLPFMTWVKRMEIDFIKSIIGDQEIIIHSYVSGFEGSDAHINCSILDNKGIVLSRCQMIVSCVNKKTLKPMDWPEETIGLFFEESGK